MKLNELPGAVRCRPRELDALGGIVTEFAAFFSTSALQGFRVLVSSSILRNTGEAGTRRPSEGGNQLLPGPILSKARGFI